MRRGRKPYPEMFRAAAPDAAEVLIGILNDEDAPLSLRVKCAEIILDRGYGRPRQAVAVEPAENSNSGVVILPARMEEK